MGAIFSRIYQGRPLDEEFKRLVTEQRTLVQKENERRDFFRVIEEASFANERATRKEWEKDEEERLIKIDKMEDLILESYGFQPVLCATTKEDKYDLSGLTEVGPDFFKNEVNSDSDF